MSEMRWYRCGGNKSQCAAGLAAPLTHYDLPPLDPP